MDLAEDDLEQFPERLGLLQSLVARDVVVATAEGEEQRVRRCGFQLVEPRAFRLVLRASTARDVRDLDEADRAAGVTVPIAESLDAVGPHAVGRIWACRHVAVQLSDPVLPA